MKKLSILIISKINFYSIRVLLSVIFIIITFNFLKAKEYIRYNNAKIQVLNKITGKNYTYEIPVNKIINIDNNLSLIVKVCYKTTQKYSPEDVIFLQVAKTSNSADSTSNFLKNAEVLNNANQYIKKNIETDSKSSQLIFSGWIFSNHPDLSGLNDPIYDITLIKCFN